MRYSELRFTRILPEDAQAVMSFCENRVLGTEIYTELSVNGADENEALWIGRDTSSLPGCVIFSCPSHKVWLFKKGGCVEEYDNSDSASPFATPSVFSRYTVMIKTDAPSEPAVPVKELSGTETIDLFRLISGGSGMERNFEKNYVYTVRCVNRRASDVFCVYEDGEPVSGAQITAKNKKYALIGNVYTKKADRGRGFAASVLAACEKRAAAQGLTPVLYCEKKMAGYYEKHGYKRVKSSEL